jgi:HlyD family secretion protein
MRRLWLFLIPVIAIAAVIAVRAAGGRHNADAPAAQQPQAVPAAVPVEVAAVTRGDVARTVEVSGTVTSARMAEIFPKQSGRVARVLAQDGARVAAGQALIQLDAADEHNQVAQAVAAQAAAEARLTLLQNGLRPQERQVVFNNYEQAQNQVKAAQTQVQLAQASLKLAEENLRRNEQLLREGAVAQAQVDQARLQHEQARAQLQGAQTQLEIANKAVDSARQQWTMTETGTRPEELAAARAQVAQARAVVASARQRLANMTIRAPFAGRVSNITLSPGDYAVSGDFAGRGGAVALVYDDRALEVEVGVGERDVALIKAGQPALIGVEGVAAPIPAVVRVVSPSADPNSRATLVRLRFQPGADLVPGASTRGEITVERRAGVLLVPKNAIYGEDEPTLRVVGADDTVQIKKVALGIVTRDRVEIRNGVQAGERVIVLGPEAIAAGAKVRVVNR